MKTGNFFSELKRRNVYKVAIAYAVAGWLVIQVATQVFPFLEIPNWVVRLIIAVVMLGFPVAAISAWAFEITPQGIKRTEETDALPAMEDRRQHAWIYVVLICGAVSTALFCVGRYTAGTKTEIPNDIANKSIAVLPFENVSEDKAFVFFADGVQDEILTDLAKIADLKVISRTSVMQFKKKAALKLPEIAQALKVSHVLEGSVQRAGNRVRVSAQLIDARDDTHIWAEKYERDLADVFAIQSEIAQAIADHLQAKLSPKEKSAINERPTSDVAAYDLYLRAKELIYEGELSPAHDLIYFFNYDHTPGRLNLAEASIANAVRLQPDAGQTHLAQAIHFYWGYRDYDRARVELTKAQQSLPNDAQVFKFLGLIERRQGRWNEGVRNLERVVELDPRNIDGIGNLAQAYFDLRRYNEAIATFDRIAQLEPGNPTVRTFRASIELLARADVAPLRAVINTIEAEGPASAADVFTLSFELALDERDPAAAARALANIPREGYTDPSSFPFPHAWFEGLLGELRGDAPAAQSAFMVARSETQKLVREQPKNEKALSVLAIIDAHLGQKDKAMREGRAACDILPIAKDAVDGVLLTINLARIYAITSEKDLALQQLEIATKLPGGPTYGELRLTPEWDSLRGDPRFQKIVNSLAPKESAAAAK